MTHSLDAYLEPTRLSFSSPPISELTQHGGESDESFPVFSPLHQSRKQSFQSNIGSGGAFNNNAVATTETGGTTTGTGTGIAATTATTITTPAAMSTTSGSNTLQPGSFTRQHRRQSSVNTVSWTDQGDANSGRVRRLSTQLHPSNVSRCLF